MINLKINDKEVKLKNRFDEITLSEFDSVIQLISVKPSARGLVHLIQSFCSEPIDLTELSLDTYLQILENFLVENGAEYEMETKYEGFTVKFNKANNSLDLALSGKQVSQLEKVYKADIEDKSSMIISILFAGEFNEELFKKIRLEKSSKFIRLLTLINPVKINIA